MPLLAYKILQLAKSKYIIKSETRQPWCLSCKVCFVTNLLVLHVTNTGKFQLDLNFLLPSQKTKKGPKKWLL